MEFKVLRAPTLTEDVAVDLRSRLGTMPGTEQLTINVDTQELTIVFDENQLSFRTLVQEMAKAGCTLQKMNAALLL